MFGALYQHSSSTQRKEERKNRTNDGTKLQDCQGKKKRKAEIGYKMTCRRGRGVTAKVNTAPLLISSPRFPNCSIMNSSVTCKHRTRSHICHKEKKSTNKSSCDSSNMVCCLSGWYLTMQFYTKLTIVNILRGGRIVIILTGPGGPGGPTSPCKYNRNIASVPLCDCDRVTSRQWQKNKQKGNNIKRHLRKPVLKASCHRLPGTTTSIGLRGTVKKAITRAVFGENTANNHENNIQ